MKKNIEQVLQKQNAELKKQLDQKKHEFKIVAALEKVRARTVAMHRSEELKETTLVLFQQFKSLGVTTAQVSICIFDEEVRMGEMFVTLKGEKIDRSVSMDLDKEVVVMKKARKAFLEKQRTFSYVIKGKDLKKYNQWRNSIIGRKGYNESDAVRKQAWHVNAVFFSGGMMGISSETPASDEAIKLLERFAKVFDLTFTRFRDLQKAEAQAREAQIDAALERIRAASMAMHKSDELVNVVELLDKEIAGLGIIVDSSSIITDFSEPESGLNNWLARKGTRFLEKFHIPYLGHSIFTKFYDAITQGVDYYSENLSKSEKNKYFRLLFKYSDFRKLPGERQRYIYSTPGWTRAVVVSKNSVLIFQRYNLTEFTKDEEEIFKRFGKVFEQAYTRFLDLQKAEAQAREAQIEAALERVRSRTMAMHQTSELQEVIHTVHNELLHLNLSIDGGSFVVINKDVDPELRCWGSGGTANTSEEVLVPHFNMPFCTNMIKGIKKGPGFFTEEFSQKEKKDFFTKLFKQKPWSELSNVQKKETLSSPGGYTRSVAVSKYTSIFIINHNGKKFTNGENEILKRFAKVFEQTYTRFLDLQNAEAQVREAKIEAALERVRAKTMAMHNSEDVSAATATMFTELGKLGIQNFRGGITHIFSNRTQEVWSVNNLAEGKSVKAVGSFKIDDHPFWQLMFKEWESKKESIHYFLAGGEKINYLKIINNTPRYLSKAMMEYPDAHYHVYYFNEGGVWTNSLQAYSNEEDQVMKRFAAVFSLTFRRYLDLQKAEAQARESQIQLALERVRARTMAMQKSNELGDVAALLFHQVKTLGIDSYSSGFTVWEDDDKELVSWMSNADGSINPPFKMPATEIDWHRQQYESWKKKEGFIMHDFTGQEMQEHYKYLRSFPLLDEAFKKSEAAGVVTPPRQVHNAFNFSQGNLLFITLQPVPEAHEIFKRFANVFEQTYTRFLDLQNAEAQVREAKIESALEKVRSRSLAMHQSDELEQVVASLFDRLVELGLSFDGALIFLFDKEKRAIQLWIATIQLPAPVKIELPYDKEMENNELIKDMWYAVEKGEHIFNKTYRGEAKNDYFRYVAKYNESKVPKSVSRSQIEKDNWTAYLVSEKNLMMGFDSWSGPITAITDNDFQVLLRFARVFEQAYTRFLDLQKAEAQAREAQIQLALERVRARTMAMYHSDELAETASVVFQQLKDLGAQPERFIIAIVNEEERVFEFWSTEQGGHQISQKFKISIDEPLLISKAYKAWKERKKTLVIELAGKKLDQFINYLRKEVNLPIKQELLRSHREHTMAFFAQGFLNITSHEPLPPGMINLTERFAEVFNLTYRRFLDLQKAEAQAREAQVEAALEKVRSRSMAMQKSGELKEVIQMVFDQFVHLNILVEHAGFYIDYKERDDMNIWLADKNEIPFNVTLPYFDCATWNSFIDAKKTGKNFIANYLPFEEKNKFYRDLFKFVPGVPEEALEYYLSCPGLAVSTVLLDNVGLYIENFSGIPYSDDENKILIRFGNVFQQTYTRFLDLQKAEAQAREAQIQLALERVRARTMAMQKSRELSETAYVLFQQFKHLGEVPNQITIGIFNEQEHTIEFRITGANGTGDKIDQAFNLSIEESTLLRKMYVAWKKQKKSIVLDISGQELVNWIKYRSEKSGITDSGTEIDPAEHRFICAGFFSKGLLTFSSKELISGETVLILERFAAVFDQSYTRFLDLEKAEAQARESQIQLALERVRARTMAMQKQNDLPGVLDLLVEQLVKLGVHLEVANFSNNITGGDWDLWIEVIAIDGSVYNNYIHFPRINHPYFNHVEKNIETYKTDGIDLFKDVFSKAEKDSWQDYIYSQTIYKDIVPQEHRQILYDKPGYTWSMVLLKNTWVSICRFDTTPFNDEEDKLLRRFANGFGLAYTRFLDLQKAEAQAREAQIEASLERVRSHAMAMQSSEELSTLIGTVFTELTKLDLALTRCIIWVFESATNAARWWMTNSEDPSHPMNFFIKYHEHPAYLTFVKEWKSQNAKFVYDLKGQDKRVWDEILFNETELKYLPDVVKNGMQAPERVLLSASFNNFGGLNVASLEPLSEEHFNLLLRFAKVFDLTYTRFLDLQKAEAQAKEAKIEAALEKVRGKAMAMHTSNDLSITSSMIIGELRKLGISPIRCGVGILNKETHKAQLYTATSSADGDNLSVVGWVLLEGHSVLENIYQKWLDGEDYFPELSGNSMKAYYHQLLAGLSVPLPDFEGGQKHYGHFFTVSVGCLYAWADVKYNDEEIKILKRFAAIIDLTFRRYFELQKSEANAKEAVKQAALDRIRADIASMRTVTDLDRITPLIWNELTIIGIPFIRCGVFIMDEQQELIHTFLSTPDGKAIAAIHIPYDTPGKIKIIPENWRKKITYTDHWNDPDFIDFANALLQQHAIESADQYLSGVPHGGFYLHFVPFLQGMMYVGNSIELSEDEINLIQSVADAFSTAYARYEDFNKLEAAKKQVDSALNELQSTQKQLIQSEKMASLGELTAGIAHEIQNPLNFVNNFSEVNNELIDELNAERSKSDAERDEQMENDILNDIKQNLEKINHHGQRAAAIVKGMLQHSRSGTGQKELTDINALCDEYLRLAYHGLRAKDKTFNAKYETDFDTTLEKINVTPQDIGRVILNLINNAFYAVSEKKKQADASYEPTVTVTTKKIGDKVEVRVKDNGAGMPQKVLDKIFQPFFTTKPTGSGTGLGLSLSYDIITKGHGGELRVETKEGEGSEFIIQLPNKLS